MNSPLTPLEFLGRAVHLFGDRTAVVDGARRFTYAEYNERIHRLASALHKRGIGKGDRVAVITPNSCMALEPHFAIPLMGAVLVMLNPRLTGAELQWILNHCEAKAVLVDSACLDKIREIAGAVPSIHIIVDDYESLLAESSFPFSAAVEPGEDDIISINYTSGTTGFPKGVMYTHRGAAINALGEVIEYGLSCDTVYLWTLPLFHCNGWCFPWALAAVGARNVLLRQVDPEVAVRLIAGERVTHLCGAPVVVSSLAQYCARTNERIDGLRIVTAGAPPSPAVIRAAESAGARIAHAYGLTETYGPHTVCTWRCEWDELPLEERAQKKARQGYSYVIAGTGTRVVDVNMNDVPADGQTTGEVVMRGNNVMLGYFKNPDATAEAFRGGWFHSGDIAVMHPDGYIELRDRKKDIVISGGENISSIEVEKVIYDHPAVLEVAVVARPDEKWGEVPNAFVTLKEGETVTADELIAWCRTRLAAFKCPKYVTFGPLPKTATGKIRKAELRKPLWEKHAKGIN